MREKARTKGSWHHPKTGDACNWSHPGWASRSINCESSPQAGPAGTVNLGLVITADPSLVCLWSLLLEKELREPVRGLGAAEKAQGGSNIF